MSNPGGAANDSRCEKTREKDIQDWMSSFREQLGNQQVDGEAILLAEADVRAHCSDSGQPPAEAFGDPRSYATTLSAELPHASIHIPIVKRIELILGGIGSALILISATSNAATVDITLGMLLTIAIVIPLFWIATPSTLPAPLPRKPELPSRRSPDENRWRGGLAVLGLFAVCAVLWLSLDQAVFTVVKWIPPILSIVLIVAGLTLSSLLQYYQRHGRIRD
jgi:hypothetical protein